MSQSRSYKPLSKREEDGLINAARHILLDGGYLNPDRVGCPGSEVLKAIALRKMPLSQADEWILHLGSCSPCFMEYEASRRQAENQKRLRLVALAAGIAVVIGIGVCAWRVGHQFRRGNEIARQTTKPYQQSVLDLRGRSILRGAEPNPNGPPIELPRAALALSIYLPTGSEPGRFDLGIAERSKKLLVTTEGVAAFRDHITVLEVKLDFTGVAAGQYLLAIRQPGADWAYYPVLLR